MVKKIAAVLSVTAVLLGLGLWWVGPAYVLHGPAVATGMGAKLACSAKYVSGFSEAQALADLTSYSPIFEHLTLDFDESQRRVTGHLWGRARSASYVPGIGCAIDYPGVDGRAAVQAIAIPQLTAPWPAGSEVGTIDPEAQRLLDALLAQDNANDLQTRALVLVHKGQIVAESYAQGISAQTPLLGWSMAKSVTAIALGRLIQQGKLALDDQSLFPAWADDERAAISVRQLLTMTDGLEFNEIYNPGEDATHMLFGTSDSAAFALAKPLGHAPGTHFNYSSGTANLLARVMQQRAGTDLQSQLHYLFNEVFQPLGLAHTVFETDASGGFVGSSYVYGSARDWARLGLLMLNKGTLNGQQLLDEAFVEAATQPNTSSNEKAYGFQFWLNHGDATLRWPDLPAGAYAAMGNRAQLVMVVPSAQVVVVRLGWTAGDYPTNHNVHQLLERLPR